MNIRNSYNSNETNGIEPIHCQEKIGSELQNLIAVFYDREVSLLYIVGKQKNSKMVKVPFQKLQVHSALTEKLKQKVERKHQKI